MTSPSPCSPTTSTYALPPLSPSPSFLPSTPPTPTAPLRRKRIGILGAGFSGIGALLALLDVPKETRDRQGWEIEVLEKRAGVGGVWCVVVGVFSLLPFFDAEAGTDEADETVCRLPDDGEPLEPGKLPATPLYPSLQTNTAVPTMTYTSHPFLPSTPLFAPHSQILSYLSTVVDRAGLAPYLRFGVNVERAAWVPEEGLWDVEVEVELEAEGGRRRETRAYEHLIEAWLAAGRGGGEGEGEEGEGERQITHSLFYRGPEPYREREHTVVVVGNGASGWDIAGQLVDAGVKVYHSYTPSLVPPILPPVRGALLAPRLSHLTPTALHFTDGTSLPTPARRGSKTTILLCTGYRLSLPFLEKSGVVSHVSLPPGAALPDPADGLRIVNDTYLHPLSHSLFPLLPPVPHHPAPPPAALAVVSLPWFAAASQLSYAQGLAVGHAIAAGDGGWALLGGEGGYEQARRQAQQEERGKRERGEDVGVIGHKFTHPGAAEAYQSSLLHLLRLSSTTPLPPHLSAPDAEYVPAWRLWGRANTVRLKAAWAMAVREGVEGRFVPLGNGEEEEAEGAEEEWEGKMRALEEWFSAWEAAEEERK
ncbi:hypothetical protein JCM10213_008124 [Rhodosporidiobolus nylandii]